MDFHDLEAQKTGLENANPGWRVWYVPHIDRVTWCAQPTPTLNEASPEDLQKAIRETETDWRAEGVRLA